MLKSAIIIEDWIVQALARPLVSRTLPLLSLLLETISHCLFSDNSLFLKMFLCLNDTCRVMIAFTCN